MLSYHHVARLLRDPNAETRVRRAFESLLARARSRGSHRPLRPRKEPVDHAHVGRTSRRITARSFGPLSRPWRQRAALAGLGSLSRVAPRAAAWLAERLFLTPPRHAAPERERDLLRPRAVRHRPRRWATDRDVDLGSGPANPARPRLGRAGGPAGRVRRAAGRERFLGRLVRWARAWRLGGAPRHDPGDGGGASRRGRRAGPGAGDRRALGWRRRQRWAVRRWLLDGFVDLPEAIALVAPPADFRGYFERFAEACGLSAGAQERLDRRLEARVGGPAEAFDLPRFAADLPLAALVVHDQEDAEVPWADGAAIAAAWPGAELVTTRGLGHRRILRDPAVVARVTAFLTARLAPDAKLAAEATTLAILC